MHRDEIIKVAMQHGARNVRLFGSVVRGEADETSDVDFLVDMESGRSLLYLGGLLMDLKDVLGRDVDMVTGPAGYGMPLMKKEKIADHDGVLVIAGVAPGRAAC